MEKSITIGDRHDCKAPVNMDAEATYLDTGETMLVVV